MNLMYGPLRVKLDDGAFRPTRAHRSDAGLDLMCREDAVIPAGGCVLVDTGVHVAIEHGYFGKLESRSGLMCKHGVVCPGGVIDSGYTGSIVACLRNMSDEDYALHAGDKCVQLVIIPCAIPPIHIVSEMEGAERGDGGFGSTGI